MSEKGVIVELDFAAMNGSQLLFEAAHDLFMANDGIDLDAPTEARYLVGSNYLGGITEYFNAVKTKKTPQKAARELAESFEAKLIAAAPAVAESVGFRNFIKTLAEKRVRVVLDTHAAVEKLQDIFADLLDSRVTLYHEQATTYGTIRWDHWRRACTRNELTCRNCLAVAGSGLSVRSALLADMGAIGIVTDHVAYQDYTGANNLFPELNEQAAEAALELLRVK